jgi:HSF-type DNA-binding
MTLVLVALIDYHDQANVVKQWTEEQILENFVLSTWSFTHERETFPMKLHFMLENVSDPRCSQAIQWLPHGRASKVVDKERFETEILPHYMKGQNKLTSFQRQLNKYGFKRLNCTQTDRGAYYHECLLRGLPLLSRSIQLVRTTSVLDSPQPTPAQRILDMQREPNFYRMDPLPSCPSVAEMIISGRGGRNSISFCTQRHDIDSAVATGNARPLPKNADFEYQNGPFSNQFEPIPYQPSFAATSTLPPTDGCSRGTGLFDMLGGDAAVGPYAMTPAFTSQPTQDTNRSGQRHSTFISYPKQHLSVLPMATAAATAAVPMATAAATAAVPMAAAAVVAAPCPDVTCQAQCQRQTVAAADDNDDAAIHAGTSTACWFAQQTSAPHEHNDDIVYQPTATLNTSSSLQAVAYARYIFGYSPQGQDQQHNSSNQNVSARDEKPAADE